MVEYIIDHYSTTFTIIDQLGIYIIIPKCACVCMFVQVLFENG